MGEKLTTMSTYHKGARKDQITEITKLYNYHSYNETIKKLYGLDSLPLDVPGRYPASEFPRAILAPHPGNTRPWPEYMVLARALPPEAPSPEPRGRRSPCCARRASSAPTDGNTGPD